MSAVRSSRMTAAFAAAGALAGAVGSFVPLGGPSIFGPVRLMVAPDFGLVLGLFLVAAIHVGAPGARRLALVPPIVAAIWCIGVSAIASLSSALDPVLASGGEATELVESMVVGGVLCVSPPLVLGFALGLPATKRDLGWGAACGAVAGALYWALPAQVPACPDSLSEYWAFYVVRARTGTFFPWFDLYSTPALALRLASTGAAMFAATGHWLGRHGPQS